MKAVIAIDSFKGSLSSLSAGRAAAEGIKRIYPNAETVIFPVADGGEGTVDALVLGTGGEYVTLRAQDPLGREIECRYGMIHGSTAVIEMSAAAGLTLLTDSERDPMRTTTYGVGQIIAHAISRGCRDFLIGIGGSATNDGGIGMLSALGFDILDKNGAPVRAGALGVRDVCSVSAKNALPELKDCRFRIACDVNNPLCGVRGCSAVYAPQKGAGVEDIEKMDAWLADYAKRVREVFPSADPDAAGAGAAGGVGFAFMSFLSGSLCSGISLVLDTIGIEDAIKDADIVVTGEGRIDRQTAMGKAPAGIAAIAKKHCKRVVAFSGCAAREASACNQAGIDAFFPILRMPSTLAQAMDQDNAALNLADTAEQVFSLIRSFEVK